MKRIAFLAAILLSVLAFSAPAAFAKTAAVRISNSNFVRPVVLVMAAHEVRSAVEIYVVRPGDTLCSIARHEYGSADSWPALWYANRNDISNPNDIRVGQTLKLGRWHPDKAWIAEDAADHVPAPKPPPAPDPAPAVHHHAAAATESAPAPAAPSTFSAAPGSFEACVIRAESGGDPTAVNPSTGAGGLFGFLPSTWAALGFPGLPENAPVSMQYAAFAKEYAAAGTSPWAPYDGC